MNIRPKTMRRLAIILAACAIIAVVFTALYISSQKRAEQRLLAERKAGMAAFAEGDYQTALARLSKYVSKRKDDPDALFAYGKSRARVEETNGKHIVEAMGVFRLLLSKPLADEKLKLDAQHMLLEIYDKASFSSESITLADELLAAHPDDTQAMKYKATALSRLRQYEPALAVAQKRNEIEPLDLDGQLQTLNLLFRLKKSKDELVAHAEKLRQQHPDDPRFELLLGVAYGYGNDETQARTWLRAAASRKAPNAEFVTLLTRYFDDLKLFDESQAVLERADRETNDPAIRQVLIQRLWQSGRASEVVRRLESLDAREPSSDSELLAFKALSLYRLNRAAEAGQIVEALAQRTDDPVALAWSTAMQARFADPELEPKELVNQLQAALVRDPDNAQIRFMLGEAFAQLGEDELALQAWQQAAEEAPSWAAPRVLRANTLTRTGRTEAALSEAVAGFRSAPNISSAVALAVAWHARVLQTGNPEDARRLLNHVADIQEKIPGESATLPIYVSLLARAGEKDKAADVVQRALRKSLDLPQETLLRLATVSRDEQLGLEKQILDQMELNVGLTPAVAYARAADLASGGQQDDGLKYLQAAAGHGKGDPLSWRLAIAQYKDAIRHPTAVAEWRALADENPSNLRIQNLILDYDQARTAWQDRDLIARTIERLRKLTGDDAMKWKLARARWLLGEGSERETAEAVNLLTDIVRASPNLTPPRMLLAEALEKVGNRARAIDELTAAAEQNPWSTEVTFTLARLLQAEGKLDDSRKYLIRLADNVALNPASRRRLAEMLAQHGETQRAIQLLRSATPTTMTATTATADAAGSGTIDAEKDPQSALLLADLLRRSGDLGKAEELYDKLLAAPAPSLSALQRAADFFASQRRMDRAQQVLDRVRHASVPEFEQRPALANFDERYVGDQAAEQEFRAAASAAPGEARAWRELSGFYLRHGQYAQAAAAAIEGLKILPADAELRSLHAQAQAMASAPAPSTQPEESTEDIQQMVNILSKDPDNEAAAETLRVMRASHEGHDSPQQRVARLRDLAGRFPRFLPIQMMLADSYLSLKQTSEALQIATRAMHQFPNEAAPAQMLVRIYADGQSWTEMLSAAQAWRQRTLDNPLQPDLMIAEAHLRLQRPSAAINQLAPYVNAAVADPQTHFATLVFYGRALVIAGRESEASDLLLPLAKQSPEWRDAWLNILSTSLPNADAAIAWIERVAPFVPADSIDQQFNLANGWFNVAQHFGGDQRAYARARAVLEPIAAKPDAGLPAILLYGSSCEQLGDLSAAEKSYRRALEIDPTLAVVKNNLAYVLLQNNGDIAEARRLASEAVAASPMVSGFYDTLARVQSKNGENAEAIKNFEMARKLQPNSLEALIGLADILSRTGQRDRALPVLQQIDTLLSDKPDLSPPLKQQLDTVREALSSSM